MWPTAGVRMSVLCAADVWATSSGSVVYGANAIVAQAHGTEEKWGTKGEWPRAGGVVATGNRGEGSELAGALVAGSISPTYSSWHGGWCSGDEL